MENHTSAINVQVDSKTKKEATEILNQIGISMSTLINATLKQVIINKGIPFELSLKSKPSESMIRALQEAYAIAESPENYKSYDNANQLFKDVLDDNWTKTTRITKTKEFDKHLKKMKKQGKDLKKLEVVIDTLASKKKLDKRYRNHKLRDNKYFKNCYECHIEPDWLLVYRWSNNELVLLLVGTGSHSELF